MTLLVFGFLSSAHAGKDIDDCEENKKPNREIPFSKPVYAPAHPEHINRQEYLSRIRKSFMDQGEERLSPGGIRGFATTLASGARLAI